MKVMRHLAWNDFKRLFLCPKIYLILIITSFFMWEIAEQVNDIARQWEIGVSPYLYPVYVSEGLGCLYTILLIVVLMSDAPFANGAELYTALRVQGWQWYGGKLLYIVMLSVFYQCMMIVISILGIGRNLAFGGQWGDALEEYLSGIVLSITMYGDGQEAGLMAMVPCVAVLLQFCMNILVSILLGIMIFCINGFFKNYSGTFLVGVLACLYLYFADLEFFRIVNPVQGYIPFAWINLQDETRAMGYGVELVVLTVLILIVAAIGCSLVQNRWIQPVRDKARGIQ